MDEWSQLATLKLMTIYARKCFPRRTRKVTKKNNTKGFYEDEDEEEEDDDDDADGDDEGAGRSQKYVDGYNNRPLTSEQAALLKSIYQRIGMVLLDLIRHLKNNRKDDYHAFIEISTVSPCLSTNLMIDYVCVATSTRNGDYE